MTVAVVYGDVTHGHLTNIPRVDATFEFLEGGHVAQAVCQHRYQGRVILSCVNHLHHLTLQYQQYIRLDFVSLWLAQIKNILPNPGTRITKFL